MGKRRTDLFASPLKFDRFFTWKNCAAKHKINIRPLYAENRSVKQRFPSTRILPASGIPENSLFTVIIYPITPFVKEAHPAILKNACAEDHTIRTARWSDRKHLNTSKSS